MNKHTFIERLNLHLDGELSEAESAELLEAVRSDPEYHRIYVQYCKLFNACSQLGERFIEQKTVSPWRQKLYAIGGMAAAGALLIMAGRNLSPLLTDGNETFAQSAPMAAGIAGADSESLAVIDVDQAEGQGFRFGTVAIPASFELEKSFDRQPISLNLNADNRFSFARFTVNQEDRVERAWAKKVFTFGEAVEASTFEHEAFSNGEGDERVFSTDSLRNAVAEDAPQGDFSKAAAVAVPPSQ